jgi:hypothetical protein
MVFLNCARVSTSYVFQCCLVARSLRCEVRMSSHSLKFTTNRRIGEMSVLWVVVNCDIYGRSVIILKIDTTGRSLEIDTTGRSVISPKT